MPSRRSSLKLGQLQMSAAIAEVVLQELRRRDDFAQDGAAPEKLDARRLLLSRPFAEQVHAAAYSLLCAFRHRRVRVVLVHQRDVVVDVVLILEHTPQPILDDDRDLIGKRRIVGDAVGDGGGEQVAVAILVLQPFAVEGRASGGAAEQEAAGAHIARRPGEIAHALQPKHRVVDVERDHRHVARAVRGRGRDP